MLFPHRRAQYLEQNTCAFLNCLHVSLVVRLRKRCSLHPILVSLTHCIPPLCTVSSSTILSHTPSSNLQFSLSSSLSCDHVFHSAPSARFTSFALPPLQNETANRLAFLYRVKSREEKENRKSTEEISVLLLRNILPDHVAQHYIENGQQGAVSGRGEWVGGANVGSGRGGWSRCG